MTWNWNALWDIRYCLEILTCLVIMIYSWRNAMKRLWLVSILCKTARNCHAFWKVCYNLHYPRHKTFLKILFLQRFRLIQMIYIINLSFEWEHNILQFSNNWEKMNSILYRSSNFEEDVCIQDQEMKFIRNIFRNTLLPFNIVNVWTIRTLRRPQPAISI